MDHGEDAMARMTRGPAAEESTGESNVLMPSDCPEDVEPPPQSVVDVERSQYQAAWREDMIIELDGHKPTGTYEAATPPPRRKPVIAKWVFSYKTDKDGNFLPSVGQIACSAAFRCLMQKQSTPLFTRAVLSLVCSELTGSCVRGLKIIRGPQHWLRTLLVLRGTRT